MSLFDWLLVGHLVGDFMLQTDRMAAYKARYYRWLLRHVTVYMIIITIILVAYALTHPVPVWLFAVAWLFLLSTHIILDRRHFTLWWMRLVGLSSEQMWLNIVVDQVFHIITLAIVAQSFVWVSG
jgi:hypothetical protein